MKKEYLLLLAVIFALIFFFVMRKKQPVISANINSNGDLEYKIVVDNKSYSATKLASDKQTTMIAIGKYGANVSSEGGTFVIWITLNGKTIQLKQIKQ